jgi:hypothetical protein
VATGSHDDNLDEEDGRSETGDVKPTFAGRLRSGLRLGGAGSVATERTTKRAIEQLDNRERRFCFAAAGLAVVTGLLIYLVETENSHFRLRKGQLTPQTSLVIGLVAGALLFGATLIGRRAPVGFVALFTFLAFGTLYFSGIPFLVLAVWLLYRSYKIQKEAAAARRAAAADGGSSTSSRSRGARGSTRTGSAGTGSSRTRPATGSSRTAKGSGRPEANKRYTPKRPPPPAPKPSRRERKAAQASD